MIDYQVVWGAWLIMINLCLFFFFSYHSSPENGAHTAPQKQAFIIHYHLKFTKKLIKGDISPAHLVCVTEPHVGPLSLCRSFLQDFALKNLTWQTCVLQYILFWCNTLSHTGVDIAIVSQVWSIFIFPHTLKL